MSRPVILTCALTGGAALSGKNPAVPVTPAEIAQQAVDAAKAGATIAHIHVREPGTGAPSMRIDLYSEVVDRIRQADCGILINLTTGPGARFIPGNDDPRIGDPASTLAVWQKRVEHIEALRPDICSLDVGSMNFGQHVFINTPADLKKMAEAIRKVNVKPEMETFELGHIRLAKHLIEQGLIEAPPLFQICLGIPWGAPATPEVMMAMRNELPGGAEWAAFGIGAMQFPMVAQAVLLGGHVRVGLEDNLYLRRGMPAPHNAALVERAVTIIEQLDRNVASPGEARAILKLGQPEDVRFMPTAGA
ncbi:3-keto-5-aminohexanoate cleavage protein [Undibacter mobilis]|uniref:3-keto-5-aminohexanoate cleavage protein n=1 Tax=Undibacter mobilis TaxID=2292256 RepID=A0A371BAP6_9BRAD|nr:3-keto-5-aminohexanoate cleavage protein [Undibacter mobilis]RDV04676.1 3-keto-5-aminohexanoate cleavage protein [Undibacter mobilis]